MRKIKDERLIVQNLKNIRIAFLVQTIGIIAILVYDVITKGLSAMTDNPVWFVFMVTVIVLILMNMRVSVDVYDSTNDQKKRVSYYWIVLLSILAGTVIGLLQAILGPDHSSFGEAILVGGVVFICFLASFSYGYYLRKKRSEDG